MKEEFLQKINEMQSREMEKLEKTIEEKLKPFLEKIRAFDVYDDTIQNLDLDESYKELFNKWIKFLGVTPPIKLLKDLLSYYENRKNEIITNDIPLIMTENGLDKIKLISGETITIKKFYTPKVNRENEFYEWLTINNYDYLLTSELKFKKGELKDEIRNYLKENGFSYVEKNYIHYQTLAKFIKDTKENGRELPSEDILTVNIFNKASIK